MADQLTSLYGEEDAKLLRAATDIETIIEKRADWDETVHEVKSNCDTIFSWDYEQARPGLMKLYEKAKSSQWNASTDIDWTVEVDPERIASSAPDPRFAIMENIDLSGTPFGKFGEKEWIELNVESQNWMLSQFLHGEQGALLCTAKIVETVPWIDAKYYASTQVMDEARHVEVFGRYLKEKLGGEYPVNAHLRSLLDSIIEDDRWDMTYLGMQIMVEGLALAAFGFIHSMTPDPLLKEILRYVMSDEARHVAFGVLSLKEIYQDMTEAEIKDRQEFAYEAAVSMRDRFLQQEVWEKMGLPVKECVELAFLSPARIEFQKMLFSKIVPNLKKLGLLEGWLRQKFADLGVLQFENAPDTEIEYEAFQVVGVGA